MSKKYEEDVLISEGKKSQIVYFTPKNKNDLKRWGREMIIHHPHGSVKLDGRTINSIKTILSKSGEIKIVK